MPAQSTCKKCGNQIVWFRHANQWIAVDAERVEVGEEQYEPSRHGSHWENCKKNVPHRYVKPENFPVCQTMESDYVRAIPEDEDRRMDLLIGSPRNV